MFATYQGGEPVRTFHIGRGSIASRKILSVMRDEIYEGSKNYLVRRFAESIVAGLTCDYDKVLAVWEFVTSESDYQFDPRGYEYIRTPYLILTDITQGHRPQLDCDDMTVLSLSLLASIGVPVRLRAASYSPDKKLTHVYGLAWIGKDGVWLPIDCVNKNSGPGWQKTPYTNMLDWKVT